MSVNLSTNGFYGRSAKAMTALTQRAETLQTQVSTGRKLQAPSDDGVAFQRLAGLKTAGAADDAYLSNVKLAKGVLAQADSTLDAMTTQLQKAGELAIQAGNGTLSAAAKKAIATQLSGVLDTLVSLANTTDARGAPLFGGTGEGAAVTRNPDGSLAFAAGRPSAIPIGDGQDVQPSVAAFDVLRIPGGRDIGQVLTAMVDALNAGDALPAGAKGDMDAIAAQTVQANASVGARAVRVDLQATFLANTAIDRETTRSAIEDVDVTGAITELQKTMTILSATQASFSKLSQLSLFSYLR